MPIISQDIGFDPNNPTHRIYGTRKAQPWHTDEADVVGKHHVSAPCFDYCSCGQTKYDHGAGLLCLKTAKEGGHSSWASSITVHNELLKEDLEAVRTLAQPFFLDRKDEVPPGKGPYVEIPVFNYHDVSLQDHFQQQK